MWLHRRGRLRGTYCPVSSPFLHRPTLSLLLTSVPSACSCLHPSPYPNLIIISPLYSLLLLVCGSAPIPLSSPCSPMPLHRTTLSTVTPHRFLPCSLLFYHTTPHHATPHQPCSCPSPRHATPTPNSLCRVPSLFFTQPLYRTSPPIHRTSLYLTVHHCTSLYITVPHCTSLYLTVPHCTSLYLAVPRCTSLYLAVPHHHHHGL